MKVAPEGAKPWGEGLGAGSGKTVFFLEKVRKKSERVTVRGRGWGQESEKLSFPWKKSGKTSEKVTTSQ